MVVNRTGSDCLCPAFCRNSTLPTSGGARRIMAHSRIARHLGGRIRWRFSLKEKKRKKKDAHANGSNANKMDWQAFSALGGTAHLRCTPLPDLLLSSLCAGFGRLKTLPRARCYPPRTRGTTRACTHRGTLFWLPPYGSRSGFFLAAPTPRFEEGEADLCVPRSLPT